MTSPACSAMSRNCSSLATSARRSWSRARATARASATERMAVSSSWSQSSPRVVLLDGEHAEEAAAGPSTGTAWRHRAAGTSAVAVPLGRRTAGGGPSLSRSKRSCRRAARPGRRGCGRGSARRPDTGPAASSLARPGDGVDTDAGGDVEQHDVHAPGPQQQAELGQHGGQGLLDVGEGGVEGAGGRRRRRARRARPGVRPARARWWRPVDSRQVDDEALEPGRGRSSRWPAPRTRGRCRSGARMRTSMADCSARPVQLGGEGRRRRAKASSGWMSDRAGARRARCGSHSSTAVTVSFT